MYRLSKMFYKYLRLITTVFVMLFQILVFFILTFLLSNNFVHIYVLFLILSIFTTIIIINNNKKSEFKLPWIILVTVFPIFGGIFYFIFVSDVFNKKLKLDLIYNYYQMNEYIVHDKKTEEDLLNIDKRAYKQSLYLKKFAYSSLYKNTYTKYISPGENIYKSLFEEIDKAEKFIFMEFFIIEEGYVWNSILDKLVEKVKQGVDVRIIYDDAGCISKLPNRYYEYLRSLGIKCKVFNPLDASLSMVLNFRNHRKIVVVDGEVGFTGGMNLADEYINKIEKFGYWKDSAVLLRGEAVYSLTLMFLQFWNFDEEFDNNYDKFKPTNHLNYNNNEYGFIQPFSDNPMDGEAVSENVILSIINNATKYIYIYTPYFIVDNELLQSLCFASKSGVKIKIVLPFIPDKKIVNILTKSYYKDLILSGIEVLEYKPGFIHSKCILCDDDIAVIGTINLDYRSLYYHFECGVFLYNTPSCKELKEDFLNTFDECIKITEYDLKKQTFFSKILTAFLKIFSTLM